MEIKFGNVKIKMPDEYFKKLNNENPFSRNHADFLNDLYKHNTESLKNYFEEFTKLMEKHTKVSQSSSQDTTENDDEYCVNIREDE